MGLLEFESAGGPTVLPDGRRIHPRRLRGQPTDELACAPLDLGDPARSTLQRLTGLPVPAVARSRGMAWLAA